MTLKLTPEKQNIQNFWQAAPCNTDWTAAEPFTLEFYEQIERLRYAKESYIPGFAQFPRYRGQRVLEIGVGAGTDFLQWVRHGAIATGCDLTEAAVELTRRRLALYGLQATVQQEDCEALSFPDASFDLVYSFGVIMCTPDTPRAVAEIYRVLRPGGVAKIMIYNRYSWHSFSMWYGYAIMRGQITRSLDDMMAKHQESPGTKVYSISEARRLFARFRAVEVRGQLTPYDYASALRSRLVPLGLTHALMRLLGGRFGWNLMITAAK